MLIDYKELKKIRDKYKDKKIVFISGTFDIIHASHIDFLKKSKQKGDILVVGLGNDKSIKLYKGEERPINSARNRAIVMSNLKSVDYCFINQEIKNLDSYLDLNREAYELFYNNLSQLNPDIWVYEGDLFDDQFIQNIAKDLNIKLEKTIKKNRNIHSSDIINKLKNGKNK